ncbi:MAG: hypothetical protein MZV70_62320 [Desulfobacterales bacterium]|nr:hypothetical protein [Desulfobacterales bacterium]
MKKMRDEFKTTFIFSTHDQKIVGEAEIIYTLEDGQLTGREVKGGSQWVICSRSPSGTLCDTRGGRCSPPRLIAIGVVFVLVFISVSGSFKTMMIGQITDSMLGHIQVHRKGYVASIDNLPLNTQSSKPQAVKKLEEILEGMPEHRGLFAEDQVRRHVQQLHRDDQHQAQRRQS